MPSKSGYQFSILGAHDTDITMLASLALARAEQEIGRLYLERSASGWTLVGDEAAGRFAWDDDQPSGHPYAVVIDGHTLSWEEFGEALSSLEGWRFRLVIEDGSDDARPKGPHALVDLPDHIIGRLRDGSFPDSGAGPD